MYRESGLLPTAVWAQAETARASARWASLPKAHPVVERLTPAKARAERYKPTAPTCLQLRASLPEYLPRPVPLNEPNLQKTTVKDKETAAEGHKAMVKATPAAAVKGTTTGTKLVYTDGPKQGDKAAWAWVEQFPGRLAPVKGETVLLYKVEAFDAEVVVIYKAVKKAAQGRPRRTKIFSDNLAVVDSCKYRPAPSSQAEAIEVKDILDRRPNVTL